MNRKGLDHCTLCLFLIPFTGSLSQPSDRSSLLKHLDAGVSDKTVQTKLEQPERKTDQSALAVLLVGVGIAHGVQDPRDDPTGTQDGRGNGEPEASDEERSDEAGLVLHVVTAKMGQHVERGSRVNQTSRLRQYTGRRGRRRMQSFRLEHAPESSSSFHCSQSNMEARPRRQRAGWLCTLGLHPRPLSLPRFIRANDCLHAPSY